MAVYTEVAFPEAQALFRRLGLGELTELLGIRSGIENTNYYATTPAGQWVLTLFERLPREQLPYYLELMRHLAQRGIPVPAPQPGEDGSLVHTVAGKPAAVVTRIVGMAIQTVVINTSLVQSAEALSMGRRRAAAIAFGTPIGYLLGAFVAALLLKSSAHAALFAGVVTAGAATAIAYRIQARGATIE